MDHPLSYFKPKKLLKSPHLQSTWRILTERLYPYLDYQMEVVPTPDGDIVYCFHYPVDKPKGIAIAIPGLSAYLKSPYMRDLFLALKKAHIHGVLLLPRNEAGFVNKRPITFHAGFTDDFEYVSSLYKERYKLPLYAVGYSMGGNCILKSLGRTKKESLVEKAVIISPPFNIEKVVHRVGSYKTWLYERSIVQPVIGHLKKKHATKTLPVEYEKISKITSCHDYTEMIICPLHKYESAEDYYAQNDCLQYLKGITVPTQIIHAVDDPLVCKSDIPPLSSLSSTTSLYLTKYGGHIGFIGSFAEDHLLSLSDKAASFLLEE